MGDITTDALVHMVVDKMAAYGDVDIQAWCPGSDSIYEISGTICTLIENGEVTIQLILKEKADV
jgi:hypothetical protein